MAPMVAVAVSPGAVRPPPSGLTVALLESWGTAKFIGLPLSAAAERATDPDTVSRLLDQRVGTPRRNFSTPATEPDYLPTGLNGDPVIQHGVDQYLVSDDAASEWTFLHDTVGATAFFALEPSADPDGQIVFSTYRGNSSQSGIILGTDGGFANIGLTIANGSGTLLLVAGTSVDTLPLGVPALVGMRIGPVGAKVTVNGAEVIDASYDGGAGPADSGPPSYKATIAALAQYGAQSYLGKAKVVAIYSNRFDDAEYEEREAILRAELL